MGQGGQARRARWLTSPLLVALLWQSAAVRADSSSLSVRVDCPTLGEERRAALESRAKTELLVRRESGTLTVSCRPEAVQLHWLPAIGTASEHSIPLARDAIATEEQILEALEILLRPRQPVPTAEPAPPAATAKPPAPAPAPQPAPPPAPPPAKPPAAVEPVPPADPAAGRETQQHEPPYFELFAGAGAELWSSEIGGALGPGARVLLALRGGLALSGGAAVLWALRSPDDVGARSVRIQLGGEYHFDRERRWRIGVAGLVDLLHARRDGRAADQTANEIAFGGMLRAQYAVQARPLLIAFGPTLGLRTAPVTVAVGERDVFSIPVVAPGVTAELGLGPL